MANWFLIPINSPPQTFVIQLGSINYQMTIQYRNTLTGAAAPGGWILDLSNQAGNPIIQGVPLITGTNLLEQFDYLGIGGDIDILGATIDFDGGLWVSTNGNPDAVPTYTNLGTQCNLYWVPSFNA